MESINWSTEWLTSLLWIARVFLFTVVGFALVGWFLIRRMRWGRQFWRVSGMYFIPRQRTWLSWRPILTVELLLLLTVVSVRLDVILSFQGNDLFTALQELNAAAFWRSIFIFGILATISAGARSTKAGLSSFLENISISRSILPISFNRRSSSAATSTSPLSGTNIWTSPAT